MVRRSKKSHRRRRNPLNGTFIVTHANPSSRNPASKKAKAKYYAAVERGDYSGAARTMKRIHAGLKGSAKRNPLLTNPSYKVTVTTSGDSAAVRKVLKAAGFTDVKVKASVKGPKRKPGPYAIFVQSQMPALIASGVSAPQAMKKIGEMWRARGVKSNPRRRASRSSSKTKERNPGNFKVVKFGPKGLVEQHVISRHATLKEAQAAHSRLVLRDGKLRADYLDYGIVD